MTPSPAYLFLVAVTVGTMLLQYPVGRLFDILDRRLVILLVVIISASAAACAPFLTLDYFWPLIILMRIYGGFSMTIHSLCIAHANDYLTPRQMVGAASPLIMINGMGAIIGSPLISLFIELVSNRSYFAGINILHVGIVIFALARMKARGSMPVEAQGPFIIIPEAGTAVAANLNPEAAWEETVNKIEPFAPSLSDNPYLKIPAQSDNS